jgi:multiple sugar transport system substrate-binding protein
MGVRPLRRSVAGMLATMAIAVSGVASANAQADPSGNVSFMVFGDPAELAAYQGLVDAFESAHPTIDVELMHVPDQADYRQRLGADFAAGTPADVVLINYRRYAPFAERGVLEPLGPYLASSDVIQESDFYTEALDPFRWDGEVMCIPQNLSSLVVYYNKHLFDDAGLAYPSDTWTWQEFLDTAKALTKDTDGDGRTDQFGLGTEASIFRLAPFIWQNGGELVDNESSPTRLALDTPEAREAVQWFVDLQVAHHVVPDATEEAAEDSESRFQNGRTAMFLNSRRGTPTYREITGFDWDVAALPNNRESAGILHSDAYCMPSSAENKEAIWTFIEFANSAEGQEIIARSGRTVPSLIEVANSPAFLDPEAKPANSQVFLSTLPDIRAVPVIPGWVDIESTAGEELERAFYGTAIVDEVIQTTIERTLPFFSGTDEE